MIGQHARRFWLLLYAVAATLILSGCSGGSDSPAAGTTTQPDTVSGTAAAGAPLVGFVGAKDGNNDTATATIEPDGSYALDLTGLTPPVLIYASGIAGGNAYELLSVAFADDINGTVNITPLTNLIVANAAGLKPQEVFNNPNFLQITKENVEAQEQNLKTRLKPLLDALGVEDNFDLRNTPFTANRSGFDAALDVIKVEVSEAEGDNTATITNRLDPAKTLTNSFNQPDSQTSSIEVDETTLTSGVTTLQAVNTLISTVANALENNDRATLEPLLTADFLNNGETATEWLDRLLGTEDADELAADLRNWSLASQEAGVTNINIGSPNGTWKAVDDGGVRKLAGNQLQFFATVEATHVVQNGAQPPAVQEIGVSLFADNQVAALGTIDTSTVSVTGPQGTPFNTGLTAQTDFFGTFFVLDNANLGQIQTGDTYDFTWSNPNGASASVPFTVRRGSPQLTEGAPLIISSTADLAADQYTFEWTLPPGYESVSVRNNFTGQETGTELSSGDRTFTGNLPAGFVPQAGNELRLIARDPFGVFVAARLENPFADQIPPAMAEDALIGSWILRNTGRPDDAPYVHISFLESGYYMHQELDVPFRPAAEDAGNTGIEFGRYEWDNETGELTVPEIIIDDNRFWGLTDVENGENRLALAVDGDTLTFYNPAIESAETIEFTRVPLNQTGITGSWLFQNPSDPTDVVVATLLEDGFYFVGSTTPAEPEFETAVGLEFGTYTYNSETLVLNASPIFDQNGTAGLSAPRPRSFYYSTVVDGSLIFDEGEGAVAQLSELAPGVVPSNGDVTVDYVSPDDGTTDTTVTGDFHYLRNFNGIEGQREGLPPTVFQATYNHVATTIADNGNGTGTIGWSEICFADLLVDANTSPLSGGAAFDAANECFPSSSGSINNVNYTAAGLSADLPAGSIFEDGSEIRLGTASLDMIAVDANRSLFIGQTARDFEYEEANSFTDGIEVSAHVLSKKSTGRTEANLEGRWGFIARSILDIDGPNDLSYEGTSQILNIDAAGNVTRESILDRRVVQDVTAGTSSLSIEKEIENTDVTSIGPITITDDGTLNLFNEAGGGFLSADGNVIFGNFMNPITPQTPVVLDSQWFTMVRMSDTFSAADLEGNEYAVIHQYYVIEPERFEVDYLEPGATFSFPVGGGPASMTRTTSFAYVPFQNNVPLARETDPTSTTDLDYSVAADGRITLTTDFGETNITLLEMNGFATVDARLLILEETVTSKATDGTTDYGSIGITYAICTNCD